MTKARTWICFLFLTTGTVVTGCASSGTPQPHGDEYDTRSNVEVACDAALVRLDELIALRKTEPHYPRAPLLEAIELHAVALELYAEREYSLALELLEQGIELIREDLSLVEEE